LCEGERGGLVDDAEWRTLMSAHLPHSPPLLVPQPAHWLSTRVLRWQPRWLYLVHMVLTIVQWCIPLALVVAVSVGLVAADTGPGTVAAPEVADWVLGALVVASGCWIIAAGVWSLFWVRSESLRLEESKEQALRRAYDAAGEFSPMRVVGLDQILQDSRETVRVEVESYRAWSLLWSVYLLLLVQSLALCAASLITGLKISDGITGVVSPVEILNEYAWHALDVIPLVEVTQTLGWKEPHTPSAVSFALSLVLARFLVVILIASAFRSAWTHAMAGLNRDRPTGGDNS
jgi:hypothetical protein